MYLHSTRGRLTPRNSDLSFPFPQSDLELIALARRCITLCLRFPSVLCFLRLPVCIWPFSSPRALRLRSLPHLSCVLIVFFLFRPRAHCAPLRVPSHRARVLPSVSNCCAPTAHISATTLRALGFHTPPPCPSSRAVSSRR